MDCISQFLIFASDSSLILTKEYRKDGGSKNKDLIIQEIMEQISEFYKPYLVIKNKIHCFLIKRENVYICATTTTMTELDEINIIEILTRFADIVQDFCGELNEKVVRNNITLIYEILEEFLVDGFVQVDSTEKMKPLIFIEPVSINAAKTISWDLLGINSELEAVPSRASSQPIVRQKSEQQTSSRKKEIFLDFLENLSMTIEKDGTPSRKQLVGKLMLKCFLTGNHSIRITFTTKADINNLDSMIFHESVRRSQQDQKSISFMAPDREVTLMRYKMEGDAITCNPLNLWHDMEMDPNSSRDLKLNVKLTTNLPSPNSEITKVVVKIPVPKSTTSITEHLSGSLQTAHLDVESKQLVWSLKKIPDKFEISADFRLINALEGYKESDKVNVTQSSLGTATLDFEMAGDTISGLRIGCLVVEDTTDSQTMRWIRYIVSSDCYTVQL